jgi:hypothetical protein
LLRDVKLGRTTDGTTDSSNNSTNKASSTRGVAYAPSTVRGEATLPIPAPTAVSDSYFDDVNDDSTSNTDIGDTDGTDSDSESSSSDVIEAPLLVPQPQLTEKQLRKQERLQKEQRLREALEAPGWTEAKLKMMSVSAAYIACTNAYTPTLCYCSCLVSKLQSISVILFIHIVMRTARFAKYFTVF